MATQTTQKFLFEVCFDGPGGDARRAPSAEPSFSRAEIEAAEKRGREAGYEAGLAAARAERDEALAANLQQISTAVAGLVEERQAGLAEIERQALAFVLAAARKLAPALARHNALGEIEALMANCLRENFEEPRIVLRIPDALFEPVRRQILPAAERAGFAGKIIILADDALDLGACRIEWAEGGIERDPTQLWREIEAAAARAAARPNAPHTTATNDAPRSSGEQ
jgi:flagellar assembly protein FliH